MNQGWSKLGEGRGNRVMVLLELELMSLLFLRLRCDFMRCEVGCQRGLVEAIVLFVACGLFPWSRIRWSWFEKHSRVPCFLAAHEVLTLPSNGQGDVKLPERQT